MDYANLAIIDLSKAQTLEGRAELAKEACDAMRDQGFFYAINHGLSAQEVRALACVGTSGLVTLLGQTARIFDIADVPFSQVNDDEKQKYRGTMLETGSYQGYKLRNYWVRLPLSGKLNQ